MNWPIFGIAIILLLGGVASIVWATSFGAFTGVLRIVEEFLPDPLQSNLRRIVNTAFGILVILIGLFLMYAARRP
ncbi:MAG: hypothetical protein JO053_13415 [Acidobacteria bacterium]|nr:hypothetical protein [Acidobacteriota bacterium]